MGCEPDPGLGDRPSLSCPCVNGAAPVPSLHAEWPSPVPSVPSATPTGHCAGSRTMPELFLLPTRSRGSRAGRWARSQRRGSSHTEIRDRFPRRKGRSINCRAQLCARAEALLQFGAIFHALRNSSSSRGAQKVKAALSRQRFHAHPAEPQTAGAGHGPNLWSGSQSAPGLEQHPRECELAGAWISLRASVSQHQAGITTEGLQHLAGGGRGRISAQPRPRGSLRSRFWWQQQQMG